MKIIKPVWGGALNLLGKNDGILGDGEKGGN